MSASVATVVAALAGSLADDPGRPLVTFYDQATGERVELSVKTFDNWVSKIANLLSDELMVDPGATVLVDLPTHWQSTVVLLGAWTAGLGVWLADSEAVGGADVSVSVVGPAATSRPESVAGQPIACSLRPLGGPFLDGLPPGWLDFGREVPSQPDMLLTPATTGPADVAVTSASGSLTHQQLMDEGKQTASELGLTHGGRLLTDANPAHPSGLAAGLLAPLVTGACVVLVAHCDGTARGTIAAQERVTASFWLDG